MNKFQHYLMILRNQPLRMLCKARLPHLNGELIIQGLNSPIKIFRDKWGIPHICAQNKTDLFFAQGFVHAQDRLWQMEFNRRLVSGRLSEVIGSATVSIDRWLRTLRMYHVASMEVPLLKEKTRELLQSYADGINYFIEFQKLPVEFSLLRYKPEPWQISDTLSWIKMMSWSLSVNWETELLRADLIKSIGPELASELEPPHLLRWPYIIPPGTDFTSINTNLKKPKDNIGPFYYPSVAEGLGSNNWVLTKERTKTGAPILANDMHLPMNIPAIWYENHLIENDLNVTGITFPGIPGVISGHNGKVAWGFTNGFADVQDLFIEHLNEDQNGNIRYEYNGNWEKAEIIKERILIKGQDTEIEEVILTRHGPIINNLAPELTGKQHLALHWTSLEPDNMIEGLFDMMSSNNCDELHRALQSWTAPVQNVVFADIFGNIGYTYAGKIPIRSKGTGKHPVPGWTSEYEWIGYVPFEQLPHLINPSQGYIITANNRTIPNDYPIRLDIEPISGDRAQRISELISQMNKDELDLAFNITMQFDQISPSARILARYIANLSSAINELDKKVEKIIYLFKNWDGHMSSDSPIATIYKFFAQNLISKILMSKFCHIYDESKDAISASMHPHILVERLMGKGPTPLLAEISLFGEYWLPWLIEKLEDPESHWFDLGKGENRDDILYLTLYETISHLEKEFSDNIQNWAWGNLHQLKLNHSLSASKLIGDLFNRGPYPIGGDHTTIWAAGIKYHTIEDSQMVGPAFRMVIDLGNFNNSMGVLMPGQSGNPASPFYDDQVQDWFNGSYHPMLYNLSDIKREAINMLTLLPKDEDS